MAKRTSKSVIVAPFGVGGTSVLQWVYGYLSYQLDIVLSNMKGDEISPQIFLWHQAVRDSRYRNSHPADLLDAGKKRSI